MPRMRAPLKRACEIDGFFGMAFNVLFELHSSQLLLCHTRFDIFLFTVSFRFFFFSFLCIFCDEKRIENVQEKSLQIENRLVANII